MAELKNEKTLKDQVCEIFGLNSKEIVAMSIIMDNNSMCELRTVRFVQIGQSKKVIQLVKKYSIIPKLEDKNEKSKPDTNSGSAPERR